MDDEDFGGAVVDWRVVLGEVDGVVDEREKAPTTTNSILSDGSIAGEGRETRAEFELSFLNTRHEDVFPGEEVNQLRQRIAQAVTIPQSMQGGGGGGW